MHAAVDMLQHEDADELLLWIDPKMCLTASEESLVSRRAQRRPGCPVKLKPVGRGPLA